MSGKIKSQWDFSGELFPAAEMRRVLSVTELTANVRRILEERVGQTWVTGEVSNLRAQSSGHLYFSLKDAGAQLACVCFRDEARGSRHLIKDGQKVVLHGDVTVYEARGQYQLIVHAVELAGLGALQAAFEKLKVRLQAEGLFEAARKRALPSVIHRIGVVSSPTGAALRDVIHVVQRRQPSLEMVLAPCRVQGQGAADEITRAIRLLNDWSERKERLDLILVTRGGGSIEDLWAFNEEAVARAVFQSLLPVVSAIGHEIDFTICDFVADLRAATPTAGAELITEGMFRRREWIGGVIDEIQVLAARRVRAAREMLTWRASRLARQHPRRRLNEQRQHSDDLQEMLRRCVKRCWQRNAQSALLLRERLGRVRPSKQLDLLCERLADGNRMLMNHTRQALMIRRQRLQVAEAKLAMLSPDRVLARGFSITTDAGTGKIIRQADAARAGQSILTRVQNGTIHSTVDEPA